MRISDWSSDVGSSDLFDLRQIWQSQAPLRKILIGAKSCALSHASRPIVVHGIRSAPQGCSVASRYIVVCGRLCRAMRLAITRSPPSQASRSEEHTSELQSLMRISYAVFCLTQ